jgi:DNA-binding winged helix-turn-helix (wHTH) protein
MFWSRIYPQRRSKLRAGAVMIDRTEHFTALGSRPLALSPLLFGLLEHLAERPGQLVTRAELKRVLWPYARRIDTERRLNTAMRALRAALGDHADAPRFIETVRGQGYRWIGHRSSRTRFAAIAFVAAMAFSLAQTPGAIDPAPDIAATLKVQNAMEQWRREPTPLTAKHASTLLAQVRPDTPSLLVMKAELEIGSQWRWAEAERDYSRAIETEPDNADARLGLAWLRVNQGRRKESLKLVSGFVGSGVLSGERRANLGWLLIRLGRPGLAVVTCGADKSASVNDLSCSHEALATLGRYADARSVALRLMMRLSAAPDVVARVRQLPPYGAYREFLYWRARHFLPADAPWFQKAQVLADARDDEAAIAALERSVSLREPMAVKIASTRSFGSLRGDPRFARLVTEVGI